VIVNVYPDKIQADYAFVFIRLRSLNEQEVGIVKLYGNTITNLES
jgi:hypothetical protein